MKIDTSSPRLPIDRLKRPVKQPLPIPDDNEINGREIPRYSQDFERDLLRAGAEKFKEWLDKRELK